MTQTATICLLNDSFPPLIDGVANAVKNYAQVISDSGHDPVVITPAHPDSSDEDYPYSIIRYPSLDLRRMTGGYMAGIPFSPEIARQLAGKKSPCFIPTAPSSPPYWQESCGRWWMPRW